jgi:carbonic anhydrase
MRTNRTRRIVEFYFAVILTASLLPTVVLAQASRSPIAPRRELVEATVRDAYEKFRNDTSGKNADYIPYLAHVESKLFGVAIVTTDNQVLTLGDVNYSFSIQSISKVFTLALAMEELGPEKVVTPVEPGGSMKWTSPDNSLRPWTLGRRSFLKTALGASVITPITSLSMQFGTGGSASLTKERRDRMTPDQVIDELKNGNERFRSGKMVTRDYLAQQRSTATGQFPAAVVLGCVDSRAPAEIIFDAGIGDTFNTRIAGNVVNDDLLGSMEFACAVAGAKVVLIFGHTACGAVKGTIDDVEMGNLTGLLARIKPAISATKFDGEKSSKNAAYVDAVARTNVLLGLDNIRRRSPVLEDLEKRGSVQIAGAMYDLATGMVEFVG